ncbi:hypothetical protein [Leptolyngbya iicbica]|uniref:Uncharacterized protein n=1 Tax=Lyngbya confervoides BDU141951 TaxID=1574623 RepID=A0A8T6QKG1_9CYAN
MKRDSSMGGTDCQLLCGEGDRLSCRPQSRYLRAETASQTIAGVTG